MTTRPESFLPLKPVDFLILLALVEGERHGYGLLQDVAQATEGRTRLDAGNLYRLMRRQLDAGLVEMAERRPAAESGDERRRYYRLTRLGRQVARAETERLTRLLHHKSARILAEESPG